MLTAASFRPAIAAALAAAGLAALSACSAPATARPNVIDNGGFATSDDGNLRVSGAVIVATPPASGTGAASKGVFTATLTIAPQTNGTTVSTTTISNLAVTALASSTTQSLPSGDSVTATITTPVAVGGDGSLTPGSINLADPSNGGIAVTGTFTPGDVIPIVITLQNGSKVGDQTTQLLEVPVVKPCGVYQFATATKVTATSPVAADYLAYLTGTNTVSYGPSDVATPSAYECATPTVRDSQGAAVVPTDAATVTVTATLAAKPSAKPSAPASKH